MYGRLFELKNPLEAPAIFNPLTPVSNSGADFVHQNVVPRTSHEGIQFDKSRNMYFAAGQTFVLRVGNGATPNATGAFTWVPITDATGAGLPGALIITDPNGVTSVDGRNTAANIST